MSTPAPSGTLRSRIEDASRPVLTRLHALPPMLVPLGTVLLIAIGILAPLPVGLVALALVLGFVGWIAYLSWPVAGIGGKLWRLLVVALIIGLGATRVL